MDIQRILLSSHMEHDERICPHTSSGLSTVKSGYAALKIEEAREINTDKAYSSHVIDKKVWSEVKFGALIPLQN